MVNVVLLFLLLVGNSVLTGLHAQPNLLTLKQAVQSAIQYDPWLTVNKHQQDSLESMSVATGTLPDPKISLGIANIAAETFDFDQEMMTQFKVGISQTMPRGDSLNIKKQQIKLLASEYPFQRENRKAQMTVMAGQLWLETYKAQQSIALIEKDRALFEQLADIAQASYASAIGKTRQQDIIRAQLELTRLDDRLTMLKQQKETNLQELSEWLNGSFVNRYSNGIGYSSITDPMTDYKHHAGKPSFMVDEALPVIKMLKEDLYLSEKSLRPEFLYQYFVTHPMVLAVDQRIKASDSGVKLAQQSYKPEWGFNASYGYRADDVLGRERADLFSIGVSFDIPLFTGNKQDKKVQSAISKSAAVKTKKWMTVRKLIASFETARVQLVRLTERQTLYQTRLLPQMHDQAEASLTAYTNDDGDFSEVIRSRIAVLNTAIDLLGINVERQKTIVQLNYFFMTEYEQIIASPKMADSKMTDSKIRVTHKLENNNE
ncbi:MAG: transporter [Kangiella sp.]|nr:MAG: transporter [Kangiella sp.]